MRSEMSSNRNQPSPRRAALSQAVPYQAVYGDVSKIIDAARESAARSVNAAMTAAYWLIGRRIVEFEQSGEERAEYGAALIERLAEDLTVQFGSGWHSKVERHRHRGPRLGEFACGGGIIHFSVRVQIYLAFAI